MSASFSTIATVSLQLILQHLDARSLVAAAVCSRNTLAAASSPFAMRSLSSITLRITNLCEDRRCTPLSLLRFVDVEICCRSCPFTDGVLASIQSFPRLRGLDLSYYRDADGLKPLYELSNLAGVTSLKLGTRLTQVQVEHIADRLPQLRTLYLLHACQQSPAMMALRRFPHLTCLAITSRNRHVFLLPLTITHLIACAELTHLILIQHQSRAVLGIMQDPILSERLKQIELRTFEPGIDSAEDRATWCRCFAGMRSLVSLTLRSCVGVGDLISAASHAPALDIITVI